MFKEYSVCTLMCLLCLTLQYNCNIMLGNGFTVFDGLRVSAVLDLSNLKVLLCNTPAVSELTEFVLCFIPG